MTKEADVKISIRLQKLFSGLRNKVRLQKLFGGMKRKDDYKSCLKEREGGMIIEAAQRNEKE